MTHPKPIQRRQPSLPAEPTLQPTQVAPAAHLEPPARFPPRDLVLEHLPARRPVTCLTILRDDKEVYDAQLAWWSLRARRQLSQWEGFTLLLDGFVSSPEADVAPREFLACKE